MARLKLTQPWSIRAAPRTPKAPDPWRDEDGVFSLLYYRLPELASRETRSLTFPAGYDEVPPGQYDFAEAFCQGRDCDCRKVMFMVRRHNPNDARDVPRHVVTISYGWEPIEFYEKWGHNDAQIAKTMKGPCIELNSPFCEYGDDLLEVFADTCLSSPEYVDRVRRHYELFKAAERGHRG